MGRPQGRWEGFSAMRSVSALAGAALAAFVATSSSATVVISHDPGGQIGPYLRAYANLRSSGERVMIDGACLSACTMLLGMIPKERICVTQRARLGFHAAWMPDGHGRPVTSPVATQVLWEIYPADVRSWLKRKGGLTRKMKYLTGRELAAMYPPCR
jgi:hypothetical protein